VVISRCHARYAVIGQRLPVNLAIYSFSLFSVGRVECSRRPIGVNAVTDVSTQLAAGHMKFSGTHWKCIEYLTSLVPLIDEK